MLQTENQRDFNTQRVSCLYSKLHTNTVVETAIDFLTLFRFNTVPVKACLLFVRRIEPPPSRPTFFIALYAPCLFLSVSTYLTSVFPSSVVVFLLHFAVFVVIINFVVKSNTRSRYQIKNMAVYFQFRQHVLFKLCK